MNILDGKATGARLKSNQSCSEYRRSKKNLDIDAQGDLLIFHIAFNLRSIGQIAIRSTKIKDPIKIPNN